MSDIMSAAADPAAPETIRVAQFNASLNRGTEGQIITDLSDPNAATQGAQQARNVAEIIQRVNADVILVNEFDFYAPNPMQAVDLFRDNFLEVAQNNVPGTEAAAPVEYRYAYIAPSNTGVASGFDLNNNGQTVTTPGAPGYGDDALGFGNFPGQFGMLILSKYEIVSDEVRTFQEFLWEDMPDNRLPDDPNTPAPADWYSPEEQDVFRLSSKSHWDVPVLVDGQVVHILASHPTPPVFDGPEDRNGTRNADEIRLSADYATPGAGSYIYDDDGAYGGLGGRERFVLLGDQNADPNDGDALRDANGNPIAIQQLLDNPTFDTSVVPTSAGGPQQAALQGQNNTGHTGDPANDTADFADFGTNPGNLRADYALPSQYGLDPVSAGIFWPENTDPLFPLVGVFDPTQLGGFASSDHKLVWIDVALVDEPELALSFPGAGAGPLTYRAEATGLVQRSDATDDVTGASDDIFAAAYGDIAFLGIGEDFTANGNPPFAGLDWEGGNAKLVGNGTEQAVEISGVAIKQLTVSGFDEEVTARYVRRSKTTEATIVIEGSQDTAVEIEDELDLTLLGDAAVPAQWKVIVVLNSLGVDVTVEGEWAGTDRYGAVESLRIAGGDGDDRITLDFDIDGNVRGGKRLDGGAGNDTITGDEGRQRIDGGEGADVLSGGAGGDVFILRKGEADGDTILDLDATDILRFRGYGEDGPDLTIAGDTLILTARDGTVDVVTIA